VTARSILKRRGRPKGTNYARVDAPRHEEMRALLEAGVVPSVTAAAWQVVGRAYGRTSEPESKVRRLVRSYPHGPDHRGPFRAE
jgi:hypothetical protein